MAKPHGLNAEMNPADRARPASVARLTVFMAERSRVPAQRSHPQVLGDESPQVLGAQA